MTDEYRAKAEHCRRMADQVVSPVEKEMWLQLAWDWSTPGASVGRAVDAGSTLTRLFAAPFLLTPRRFPPPWSVEE